MGRTLDWISRQDARHRLGVSILLGAAAFSLLRNHARWSTQVILTWDTFATANLFLAWLTIVTTPRGKLRVRAKAQDVSRTLIFVFVVVAACAGLFSVGYLLRTHRGEQIETHLTLHLIITLIAVVSSWLLVHTVFGLRYAHTFYADREDGSDQHAGGLLFAGEPHPNYVDFAYFSFVIGMTSQTSDVTITSRDIRQLALVHGVLAFGFNTVILALAISTASGLLF